MRCNTGPSAAGLLLLAALMLSNMLLVRLLNSSHVDRLHIICAYSSNSLIVLDRLYTLLSKRRLLCLDDFHDLSVDMQRISRVFQHDQLLA